MTNLNKAKLNLKLWKIFIWLTFHLKSLAIRAEYRQKLYLRRAEIYTSLIKFDK